MSAHHANAYESSDEANWSSYGKFRPPYPDDLFDIIYQHHKANGGRFGTAHDAGCGPGITAARFAGAFSKVLCSDYSAQAVESARKNLCPNGHTVHSTELVFQHSPAEDMLWIPSSSVDLVTMSECIHWTDTAKTVESIARTLRPGGTFACWYYTDPRFPSAPDVQRVYDIVLAHWVKLRASWSKESERTLWIENSGYDCIALPRDQGWTTKIRRIKFNTDGKTSAFERDRARTWIKHPSQIGPDEALEFVENAREWEMQVDAKWLEGWFRSLMPKIQEEILVEHMPMLKEIIGRTGGQVRARWPVVLILATKERESDRGPAPYCDYGSSHHSLDHTKDATNVR